MQPRSGNPALRNGLIFGVILGVIETALTFLPSNLGLILNVLLFLFLVGLAGYRTSARTGRVGSAVLAGFLTGLISSVIPSIVLLFYFLANIDVLRTLLKNQLQASGNSLYQSITFTNNLVISFVILGLVIVIVGACLLALGVGAIGGAIGKGQAPLPPISQYPEQMYMPPPYPPREYVPPPPQE